MSIEIRDPRFLEIVSEELELELLAEGLGFTEGPIWHPTEKHLTFSDIPGNRIHRWQDRDSDLKVVREPSNMANGNTYDLNGCMLTCEHATSRVTRTNEDGSVTVLASHYGDNELNSPNDIVVRRDSKVYFTDPTYGRMDRHGLERQQQLDFQGVFLYEPSTEKLTLVADDFDSPNGLCFTLDQSQLYVNDTNRRHIRRFDIGDDGTLTGGEVFAVSSGEGVGAPDGMKIDSAGHVFCAGPGGVHIYHPADGTTLGVIHTPAFCANFTWGGDDFRTFFLTASDKLWCTRTKLPGFALF